MIWDPSSRIAGFGMTCRGRTIAPGQNSCSLINFLPAHLNNLYTVIPSPVEDGRGIFNLNTEYRISNFEKIMNHEY